MKQEEKQNIEIQDLGDKPQINRSQAVERMTGEGSERLAGEKEKCKRDVILRKWLGEILLLRIESKKLFVYAIRAQMQKRFRFGTEELGP